MADVVVGRHGGRGLQKACRFIPPIGEGWLKYKVRETTEAVGAITGTLAAPRILLLGRYNDDGRLQYTGRTTTLTQAAGSTVAALLTAARHGHPWTGWSFSARWSSRETLNVTLVEPELVVEVDVARDGAGRWRHPAGFHRIRAELHPIQLTPPPDAGESPASQPGPAHPGSSPANSPTSPSPPTTSPPSCGTTDYRSSPCATPHWSPSPPTCPHPSSARSSASATPAP
ncbi:hypothetical protein ACIO93_43740 [Streptomyces sp. NPDC087903]|uniref:ATP dependent DNA ligase n=1 Tax=Streptomyces sp. NPDC087903 TaxID=3365819 RepID=UPI0037FFCDA0